MGSAPSGNSCCAAVRGDDSDIAAREALIGSEDAAAKERDLCGGKVTGIGGAHMQIEEVFGTEGALDDVSETVATPALAGSLGNETG